MCSNDQILRLKCRKGLETSAWRGKPPCLHLSQRANDLDWGTQRACNIPPMFEYPDL